MTKFAILVCGAALGAGARYLIDDAVRRRWPEWPWGTWIVNIVASFLVGLLLPSVLAGSLPDWAEALLITGFAGALSTYSTWSVESAQFIRAGQFRAAMVHLLGHCGGCVAMVWCGMQFGG